MKAGWEEIALGDLCSIARGGSPRPIKAFLTDADDGINWIKIGDTQAGGRYIEKTAERIKPEGKSKSRYVEPGAFLLSNSMSFGRPYILRTSGCIHDGWLVLDPDYRRVDQAYLYYSLIAPETFAQFDRAAAGSTVRNLNTTLASKVTIPLPPLAEQERIVAILDEAFEGLDRAKANAEANLASAREIYLSALRSVFDNRSTKWSNDAAPDEIEPQQGSSGTASRSTTKTGGREATLRAISGSYSLSVLDAGISPRPGWQWTQLSKLARMESGHTPSRRKPEYWGGDVPWIGIKDARAAHGRVIDETLEQTNELGVANSSTRVLPAGTVCLSRTASVGYVTVMGRPMATSQDFVNWVCRDALEPEFLMHLLMAQGDEILRFASGSVHQTIYFPEAKAFHICHPPVSVQREICSVLRDVSERTIGLIEAKDAASRELDRLRQSLLAKAFAGELT